MIQYATDRLVEAVIQRLKEKLFIEVEASGRHVHLSREDVDALFGAGYSLTRVRDLSQPGQFVCQERVTITGPKGSIQNVVVLGPERKETQAEISMTDGLVLGIKAPVRSSGDVEHTPGFTLSVNGRSIRKEKGIMVAKRHIHMTPEDAARFGVKDRDTVNIQVYGSRPVIFEDTDVRVSKDFATYVHIDYDEANACGFQKGTCCRILKERGGQDG